MTNLERNFRILEVGIVLIIIVNALLYLRKPYKPVTLRGYRFRRIVSLVLAFTYLVEIIVCWNVSAWYSKAVAIWAFVLWLFAFWLVSRLGRPKNKKAPAEAEAGLHTQ